MARLLRPYIPIPVRCQVAERQVDAAIASLGEFDPETDVRSRNLSVFGAFVDRESWKARRSAGHRLSVLLRLLFDDVPHLDHDPPLGAREKVFRNGEHVGYKPDANDPDFLIYRAADLHRLKTNVRGEHGQHPDRVLIKKMRRLERGPKRKKTFGGSAGCLARPLSRSKKSTWPKRPFPKRRKS